jgi:hypothetical protein
MKNCVYCFAPVPAEDTQRVDISLTDMDARGRRTFSFEHAHLECYERSKATWKPRPQMPDRRMPHAPPLPR